MINNPINKKIYRKNHNNSYYDLFNNFLMELIKNCEKCEIMNPLKHLFNYFLNKSSTFNFYKDNYELLINKKDEDSVKIEELTNEVNNLKITNSFYNKEIKNLKEVNTDYKNQIESLSKLCQKQENDFFNELESQKTTMIHAIDVLSENSANINNNIEQFNMSCLKNLTQSKEEIIDKLDMNTSKAISITENTKESLLDQINNNENTVDELINNASESISFLFNENTNKLIKHNSSNMQDITTIKENIEKNNEYLLKYLDNYLNLDKIDIFNNISNELSNNNFTNLDAYQEIIRMKLFDETYYKKEYNYNSDIDPLLHYIYKGYKENMNPSPTFDNDYYKNSNECIEKSDLNPLVYFVSRGFKEGNILFNPNVMDIKHVNKYELDEEISNFKSSGINIRKRKPKLIVSLTSYPERVYDIHYCLYSILNQDLKPDEVILWLAEEEFPNHELDIPKQVLKLKDNGLTIKYCENIKSYKKSIPTLEEYPEEILVTADDDVYYPPDWLMRLYEEHLRYPKCIIGLRSRQMQLNDNYEFIDYNKWKLANEEKKESYLNFMTGSGGVLYPPHCFYKDVLKKEIFLDISESGDDLWFWAMAVMNRTKYKVPSKRYNRLIYINPARERLLINESTLWSSNMNENKNNSQIKSIIEKYPEIIDIIKEEEFN
ncbi:MAG: hypothetical protein BZ137_09250 [Methanosphaera sp. rholeuAM130]|nr:MAG: hypothetical protein BZ137_09250 [Methanosphaera sp. rholeuAM130]